MDRSSRIDVNLLWFLTVLLHVFGSIVFSVMGLLPFGTIICNLALWGFCLCLYRTKKGILCSVIGFIISSIILMTIPTEYQSSLLMNGFLLLLLIYMCYQKNIQVLTYCNVKKIPVSQWIPILFMTVLLIIIASFVNAFSMIFFQNAVEASMESVSSNLFGGILVFAAAPAIVEELIFRGGILQGIDGTKKAVFVSALLFALMHMNFNQMSYAFIMGIFFAIIVIATSNLTISIAIHMLFNCFSVMSVAMGDKGILFHILRWNIFDYYIFGPTFQDEAGNIYWQIIAIGIIVVILAIALFGLVLQSIKQSPDNRDIEASGGWKPDKLFLIGIIICIAVAILFEFLMN